MRKTKLYKLLQYLSAWSLRKFRQFLCSPYFNQRTDVLRLFDFLDAQRRSKTPTYDKKTVWHAVYPDEAYDEKKMALTISRLFALLEQFLAFERIKNNEVLVKRQLLMVYRKLEMKSNYKKAITGLKTTLEQQPFRNARYLQQLFDVEYEDYDFFEKAKRTEEIHLERINNLFDAYIIASKLKQSCLLLSYKAVYKKEYQTELLNEMIHAVETDTNLLAFPAVSVYYYCYKTLTDDNHNYFFKLLEVLEQHEQAFSRREIKEVTLVAINYCIKRFNNLENDFIQIGFDLYKKRLEDGLLLESNSISPFAYKNIVAFGLKLGHFEWVREFILEYKNKLGEGHRESLYNYNLARLYFEKGEYEKAMQALQKFEDKDYLLVLSAKSILLKIYYELKEYTALDSLLRSVKAYLHRKVRTYHKEHYLNIINFIEKLIALPPYHNQAQKEKLREEILNTKIQSDREWLLRMLRKK